MKKLKNNINILEDKFYYKGKEHTKEEIKVILKDIKTKLRVNIISSNLFIKKYDIYTNSNYEKFIEEKISSDFNEKNNFLFHYENLKKQNKIYLYAIRNDKFKFIYNSIKNIELIPIQFTIVKYISKLYKKNNEIIIIYNFNNKYDLININNKKIEDFISFDNVSNINLYLEKNSKDKIIIIDKNLDDKNFEKYNFKLNLKEEIYEKIYEI